MSKSRDRSKPATFLESLNQPAVRTYLFLGAAALVVYFMLMSARGGELGTMMAIVIAVPGLLGRWAISPALFLLLTTYLLYDPNLAVLVDALQNSPRQSRFGYRRFASSSIAFEDLLLGASILVYMMAQFRLFCFIHQSMPDDPPPRRKGQPEHTAPRRPFKMFVEREILYLLPVGLGCIAAGVLAWLLITGYERSARLGTEWGIEQPFARLMLFLWALFAGVVLSSVVFRVLAINRMTRSQARMLLQDSFWQETRREQERIYRWRRWFWKKSRK